MRTAVAIALAAWLWAAPAAAREQLLRYGSLQVTAWTPDRDPGRQAVLIFSHGFHGCDVQSRFLMQGLAAAGYLVFAPNHRDAACHGGRAFWTDASQQPFWLPDMWSEATYADRAADVRALLAAVHEDPRFSARADWSRLGLVGYSLGGYTALGLAGAWPRWRLPGVRVVLALAPYTLPFNTSGTLVHLSVPVMYQCGDHDIAITPMLDGPHGAYMDSPRPRYFVELSDAGHLAWTDLSSTAHRPILDYALAFLNHYLQGAPADRILTQAAPGVAELSFDSELGRGGVQQ